VSDCGGLDGGGLPVAFSTPINFTTKNNVNTTSIKTTSVVVDELSFIYVGLEKMCMIHINELMQLG
jgi:hypothetical protein